MSKPLSNVLRFLKNGCKKLSENHSSRVVSDNDIQEISQFLVKLINASQAGFIDVNLLHFLKDLGNYAVSDLLVLQQIEQPSSKATEAVPVFGLSGNELKNRDDNEVEQRLPQHSALPKDDPWTEYVDAKKELEMKLPLTNQSKAAATDTDLEEVYKTAKKVMSSLRRCLDLQRVSLMPKQDMESEFSDLERIFRALFTMTSPSHLPWINIAWIFVTQPPNTIKSTLCSKVDLHLRLFGLDLSKVDVKLEVRVISESGKSDVELEYEKVQKSGSILEVKGCRLGKSVKRAKEQTKVSEQFQRVVFVLNFQVQQNEIECHSAPFLYYTGSPQFAECMGAITWYTWAQKNLYTEPYHCPPELEFDQVLAMLESAVRAKFLQFEGFLPDEIAFLQSKLKNKSKTGKVSLESFNKSAVRSRNKDTKFTFFTWFWSVLNSIDKLQDLWNLGLLNPFVSHQTWRSKFESLPVGSAFIRISESDIDEPQGQTPLAKVTIHFKVFCEGKIIEHTENQMKPETEIVMERLHQVKVGTRTTVISRKPHLKEIDLNIINISSPAQQERHLNYNDYKSRSVKTPGDIVPVTEVSRDIQDLSLDSQKDQICNDAQDSVYGVMPKKTAKACF